jgi:hypothetical protein
MFGDLRHQPQPQVLHRVGVLIFVHHDIAEALLVLFQHIALAAEDVEHVEQQVAEIAGVERAGGLIERVEPLPAPVGIGFVFQRIEIGGVEAPVLPACRSARQAGARASVCRPALRPGSAA